MAYRNLEKVRILIKEAVNLDISYAFDDLVFPDHAAFMIQFNDKDPEDFFCYFHKDCFSVSKAEILGNLCSTFNRHGSTITEKGAFVLSQNGEEIDIKFV